jgi:hypothetical protein
MKRLRPWGGRRLLEWRRVAEGELGASLKHQTSLPYIRILRHRAIDSTFEFEIKLPVGENVFERP